VDDYELIDCGDGRRLERFGDVVVDRPAPQALWPKRRQASDWDRARAYYDRPDSGSGSWRDLSVFPDDWRLRIDGVTLELRPSSNGQVGFFPEQIANVRWIRERLIGAPGPVRVLNSFAYTGTLTLAASAAAPGVEVCHLDGARSAVSRARRNAERSGLADRPIRWIVDDVLKFLGREIKRGRRYDAFILDPPAFGRGPGGSWKLRRDLPRLLECVDTLLGATPCFVVLSCHAPELTSTALAGMLENLKAFRGRRAEPLDLIIPSSGGNALPAGTCGRI